MKTLLTLALLALAAPVAAQTTTNGTIDRGQDDTNEAATAADAQDAPVEKLTVSRNPKDMDDTSGMDSTTVITWVDSNGVRWYTDNPKIAPARAKTRQVYSMPAATPVLPELAPLVISAEEQDSSD